MLNFDTFLVETRYSKILLESIRAVKRLDIIPIVSVTANPLTGPVPN
ncbi:MAG: hypothetical protein HQK61_09060 [Desulfamplus sp.]|nr:hypothetical protein [Desulfamplus sp.]